jgi:hypothetical protein
VSISGHICPHCKTVNDAATNCGNRANTAPKVGDFGICGACARVFAFTGEGLETRKPTMAEMLRIHEHPAVAVMQNIVRASVEAPKPGEGPCRTS